MQLHIAATIHVALLSLFFHTASATVPLVMYSHTLVPKVQTYVNNYNHLPFPEERVKEVARKLVEPCTSDAYVLVNQPGITLDDLQDHSVFVFLRTYMFMSSTLAVIPRAEAVPDLDKLSDMIQRKCRADQVVVEGFEEVETYIDTKKRVIRLDFPELPTEPELRKEALMKADDALRRTLRKLPSPHHTIIYTTTEDKLYNKNDEKRWVKMDIFADVTKDGSRAEEFERNNNVVEEERYFPEKRTNLINKKLYEGATFIDPELIYDNELLVLGIVLLTAVLVLYQSAKLLQWLGKRVTSVAKLKEQRKSKEETKKEK